MKIFKVVASTFLQVFGALWLIVEMEVFFNEDSSSVIKQYWYIFFIIGFVISLLRLKPKTTYSYKVHNRDVTLELKIGNIFKEKGPIIVGSNTTFNTNEEIISSKSIQGMFCKNYFSNIIEVNNQIRQQIDETEEQAFGTTITIRGKDKIGYFCAISEVNAAGVAHSDVESFRISLGELWNYLYTNGEKDVLNIPILGSGFSKVPLSREELFREIINSFIAATSENIFCDGLRIVITKNDIENYHINVQELAEFLNFSCKYSISMPVENEIGTPEG